MKKQICERALNWIQIIDYKGTIRLCSWMYDNAIGSLSNQTLKEIYHSEKANELRSKKYRNDYSQCDIDSCPFLAMRDIDNHKVEIEEVPEYPEELYLAYENVCNYSCTSCNIHQIMKKNSTKDLTKGYDKIESEIRNVLPYLKKISANGLGELFCSKRILKLLSEWKPIAPKDEISVLLETNGSLFDEKHWKQIENLGQYNLSVAIIIMSFDERTYQYLSGTKIPITQIEDNLSFVKSLRKKGIINHLELATVVQERNFRTLPEFVEKCINVFEADSVRLRPYEPWGSREPEIEWFTDVRNPKHPYYLEYRDIMKEEIFKHPKVQDWSGGRDTFNLREFPYRSLKWSNLAERSLTDIILNKETVIEQIRDHINNNHQIIIYGIGNVGKVLVKVCLENKIRPAYILDKNKPYASFENIEIYNLTETERLEKRVVIFITPLRENEKIREDLKNLGYEDNFVYIKDLVKDKLLVEELSCE